MNESSFKKILNLLLVPISFLWEWVYIIRRFAYKFGIFKQFNFKVPIISIGNITFGGTGKTPFTLWMADHFDQLGKETSILMRGYKGKLEHGRGIIRKTGSLGTTPGEYGDEALMLGRRLRNTSVIVGKARGENLLYYFDQELPDVVLLDDGHQHLKVNRRLNFVLFDATMSLSKYKVAPSGYLREGLTALKDADIIVIGRSDQVSKDKVSGLKRLVKPYIGVKTQFCEIGYRPTGFFDYNFQKVYGPSELNERSVICLAGIASPDSFFQMVENLGVVVTQTICFPDHHDFKIHEMMEIVKKAELEDALIITTEKDMVKIRKIMNVDRILYLEIMVQFFTGEEMVKDKIASCIM